jgi:thymidylate synthase
VFGAKFAIMQYRLLQMALCRMFGMKLGKLVGDLSQYHIYDNQIEYAKELIAREITPHSLSSITIKDSVTINSLEDLLALTWDDFDMTYNYNKAPFNNKRPDMVA